LKVAKSLPLAPPGLFGSPVLALAAVAEAIVEAKPKEVEGSDSEQDDGTFDGASGPSRERPRLWVCKQCTRSVPVVSWMAHGHALDKGFFEFPDERLANVFDKDVSRNLFEAVLVRPYCCKYVHGEEYLNRTDPAKHRLVPKYKRRAMVSRGMKMPQSRVE
jgi:hypothetical protein